VFSLPVVICCYALLFATLPPQQRADVVGHSGCERDTSAGEVWPSKDWLGWWLLRDDDVCDGWRTFVSASESLYKLESR
jgi:hypothetical protein